MLAGKGRNLLRGGPVMLWERIHRPMVIQTLATSATSLAILQDTAQKQSQVILTGGPGTFPAKTGLGASFVRCLLAAGTNMMISQVVENWSHWSQVILTGGLAISPAKMGLDASFCPFLLAAGTNTMIFQVDEVLLEGQLLSAIAAMDLVTLLVTVLHQLESAEVLCQEEEDQFEGRLFTLAESSSTQPLWSVTSATRLDTLPETVPEVEEGLKSAA